MVLSTGAAFIALFEGLCDMYTEVVQGSYGGEAITYEDFHQNHTIELLDESYSWAKSARASGPR